MKIITRTAVALALCCSLVAPSTALAVLDEFPRPNTDRMTTSTNPGEFWWRNTTIEAADGDRYLVRWGNSDSINVNIEKGSAPEYGDPLGFLYDMTRTPSVIDTSTPSRYGRTIQHSGTHFTQLFNTRWYPGAELSTEGIWFIQMHFFNFERYAIGQRQYAIGIDKTKPRAVNGLTPYTSTNPSAAPLVGPSATDRLHFKWTDAEYDSVAGRDFAGVAYYQLYLNGKPWDTLTEADPRTDMAPGRVFRLPHVPAAITVDNFPPGKHTVGISAVDRATNEGPRRNIEVIVDTDVPTISLTAPKSGAFIKAKPTFTATANDKAGIKHVRFYVNNKLVATDTTKPYSVTPDLSSFAAGKVTVKAMVEDLYGRQVFTNNVTVTLDKTAPTITKISDAPDPFYPRKREGYKDDSIIKFTLSEAAKIKVDIFDSKGTIIRTIHTSKNAGATSVKWDGKKSDGKLAAEGTYRYRITATDAAGNATVSARYQTKVAYVEFQRVSPSMVRVIQR